MKILHDKRLWFAVGAYFVIGGFYWYQANSKSGSTPVTWIATWPIHLLGF